MHWETLKSETVFQTPRFGIVKEQVRLPDGGTRDMFFMHQADCAIVLPVTADGKLVLINEYRHACRTKLLSLVGGNMEEGDTPVEAARRELLEETGYTADNFEYVRGVFADPPRTGRIWHFFVARNARPESEQALTTYEDIDIVLMTPQELRAALASDAVTNLPDMGLMYLGLDMLEKSV